MPVSRSAGSGSVYQRKDGRWVAAVWLAGRKLTRYAPTEQAARAILRAMLSDAHVGTLTAPTNLTLAAWVDQWLGLIGPDRRPTTLRVYRQALTPLVARLGQVKLHRLTPALLAATVALLRREGKGTRALQQSYVYLRACLGMAVRLGVLATNPLDQVPKPRHETPERRPWTTPEAARFLDVCLTSDRHDAPLLAFLLLSGLRLSEALALTWDDVDWEQGSVRVTKALVFAGETPSLQPTKSRAGTRTVSLPLVALDLLRRLPRPLQPDGRLFRASNGAIPRPGNVRRTLRQLCDQAGVPRCTVHDLRHAHLSLLAMAGLPVKVAQQRAGHSDPRLTLRVYQHVLGDADRQAAETIDAILSKTRTEG